MYTDWTALPSHYLAPSSAEFSRLKTPPADREGTGRFRDFRLRERNSWTKIQELSVQLLLLLDILLVTYLHLLYAEADVQSPRPRCQSDIRNNLPFY